MPRILKGAVPRIAPVPAAGAPTRRVPIIMQSVDKTFSKVRVSESDWLKAEDDLLSAIFNAMMAAPAVVDGVAGNHPDAIGNIETRKRLARRISKHIPGKSLEQTQPQLRAFNTVLTELKAKTNRFLEKGIKDEKLPQSVFTLVDAEEREKKANPAANPRNADRLQAQRDAVIRDFKPAAAVATQKEIDQCKKDLQAAGNAILRSITHGETNKYVSDDAYEDYQASVQEALAELKTAQDELDALRNSLNPLALVDARTAIREVRRANSPRQQALSFASSGLGRSSGLIGLVASAGVGVLHSQGKEVLPWLAQNSIASGIAVVGVYAAGAIGTALVIGGVLAGIKWILSDDAL